MVKLNKKLVINAVYRSPFVSHLNAGSCNGCDIEIVAALTPKYDVERFGITLQGSPRHADVLLATGSVSRAMAPRLRTIVNQMPDPKFVVAIGGCAIDGGVYQNCYCSFSGIDDVVPVAMYIPGCPPRPEAIVFGAYQLLQSLMGLLEDVPEYEEPEETPQEEAPEAKVEVDAE